VSFCSALFQYFPRAVAKKRKRFEAGREAPAAISASITAEGARIDGRHGLGGGCFRPDGTKVGRALSNFFRSGNRLPAIAVSRFARLRQRLEQARARRTSDLHVIVLHVDMAATAWPSGRNAKDHTGCLPRLSYRDMQLRTRLEARASARLQTGASPRRGRGMWGIEQTSGAGRISQKILLYSNCT